MSLELIHSEVLRSMAQYLMEQGDQVIFFGQAWGKAEGNWIYFDRKLDLEALQEKFPAASDLRIHEHRDPRSGTERGFIDPETGEGLMGSL